MTKAERLDALLARLEGLPGRISSVAIGIGQLRARRAEQYDFTLQRLQGEANALRDEMWELFLAIAGARDGRPRASPQDADIKERGAVVEVAGKPPADPRPALDLADVLRVSQDTMTLRDVLRLSEEPRSPLTQTSRAPIAEPGPIRQCGPPASAGASTLTSSGSSFVGSWSARG